MPRGSLWRRIVRRFHPEGIPWPGSAVYDALSRSRIFLRHYDLVADDIARACGGGRILDVGTGPARLLLALRGRLPGAVLAGVDISPAMVAKARENVGAAGIEVREGSAGELPFPEGSFDAVVSTGSMHHWKEPVAALDEAHRVLRAGGIALMYDLVRKMPRDVAEGIRREFGAFRLALLWVHSFEEPFYDPAEMVALAARSRFRSGGVRFVGALCGLVLEKA